MPHVPKKMYVEINVLEEDERVKRFVPGERLSADSDRLRRDFAEFVAKEYVAAITKAIDRQRFVKKWPPLSVSWLETKRRRNWSENIWEATGKMKDSVRAMRRKGRWVVGISPRARYPKRGDTPGPSVLFVARCLEYGTDTIPPRPIFRPVAESLTKHIRPLWERFMRERHKSHNKHKLRKKRARP